MTGRERVVHYEFGKDGVTPVATATSPHIKASPKAEREPGFYWVRDTVHGWRIAELLDGSWSCTFSYGTFADIDFDEIGERVERHEDGNG